MRAATADLSLLNAAPSRGDSWYLFNRFTLHPAPIRTGTIAGFHFEAWCKGEYWSVSRASTLALAWMRALTTAAELLNQTARCREVTCREDTVEQQQVKNYLSSSH